MKYYIVGASDFAREKFKPEEDAFVIAADAGVLYTGERAISRSAIGIRSFASPKG